MQQTTVAAVAAPSGGSGESIQIRFSLLKALIVPVGLQGLLQIQWVVLKAGLA